MNKTEALGALNKYISEHGGDGNSNLDDWSVTDHKDALLFSAPSPLRSNHLYLVKGSKVTKFAPSTLSIDDAYTSL